MSIFSKILFSSAAGLAAVAVMSGTSWGCACGCCVLDINAGGSLPPASGGSVFLGLDHMDQNQNYFGAHKAPAADNGDKEIRTDFFNLGADYMFNRKNGISVLVPFEHRNFLTQDDTNPNQVDSFTHTAFGDVRIKGIYTGFSPDESTGVTYGVKLATGDSTYPNFDSDTEIGTGSTDLLLGEFHSGQFEHSRSLDWFEHVDFDQPVMIQHQYRPGAEVDGITGIFKPDRAGGNTRVIPFLQLIGSYRLRDTNVQADTYDSGYTRFLLAPAVEVHAGGLKFFGQVAVPIYQVTRGDQLVTADLVKFSVGKDF